MSSNGVKQEALERERNKTNFWFSEAIAEGGLNLEMNLKRILFTGESQYQEIKIIESFFGKTLVTDGKTQSCEADEFVYHESLVHPALLAVDHSVKKVFIGGGGELATAREVLKHTSVERCVMVDLDEVVVKMCQEHLPEWNNNSTEDPRLDLIFGDAHAYLMNTEETFDLIIMDISDPTEAGPGIMLYVKEFYEHVVTRLNPGGVFVTQGGIVDNVGCYKEASCIGPIYNTLNSVFDYALTYKAWIPSFGSEWGFVMAFNGSHERMKKQKNPDQEEIDSKLEQMLRSGSTCLKFYDGETHSSLFSLSKFLRKQLAEETRVMTKENPIYMF